MARSIHPTYNAAERYERAATRRPRPCQSREQAILESLQEA